MKLVILPRKASVVKLGILPVTVPLGYDRRNLWSSVRVKLLRSRSA